MSPPIQPERNPVEFLRYLRETGQREEAATFERYLTETGQGHVLNTATRQTEFASGRLARRMESENLLDAAKTGPTDYASQALGGVAALAKDIPGAEALQAGARSVARGQTYPEALADIQGAEASAPAAVRIGNRMVGGTIAGMAIPGSPAQSGAAYGGLLNLLSSNPDESLGERGFNAGVGAAVGGTVGKVADVAGTALRARAAKPLGDALEELKTAREAAAGPLYEQAAVQGVGRTGTPEIQAFLARPEVAAIVDDIARLDEFKGLAPDDPKVLQEIIRTLSDDEGTIIQRMAASNPRSPNTGRAAQRQIRTVKRAGVDAMSSGLNAPMPAQRPAMQAFAEGSRRMNALTRGQRAAAVETGSGSTPERLAKHGRTALLDFLEQRGPDVTDEAAQGVLGFGRRKLDQAGVTGLLNPMRGMARNFLLDGGDLLRAIEGPTTGASPVAPRTLLELIQKAATTGATPDVDFR